MDNNTRGILSQIGNVQRINNALVEDVFTRDGSTGNLTVTASSQGTPPQTIRLNVGRSTVILNSLGQTMCLCDIKRGMIIDSVFSSLMTRSIPPQSNAFLIVVRREAQAPVVISTGRIARVDNANNAIFTGNPFDISTQTRYNISVTTPIVDRRGNLISIHSLRPGQMVRITHSNAMTASIPPQTAAFHVQVI